MKKSDFSLILIALAVLLLVACGTDSQPPSEATAAQLRTVGFSAPTLVKSSGSTDKETQLASMWAGRKLIRTANLNIEVESVADTLSEINQIASDLSGYLAGSKITKDSEGKQRALITVRIPASDFEAAISSLKKLGEVEYESSEIQDVTKAYTDLETRLRVKRSTEQRLRELLQTRTGKLEEVLNVERELERIVTDIEQLEGEKRFYDQRVAVSTINLEVYEAGADAWEAPWPGIAEAFHRSIEVLVFSLSTLVYVVTFVVPWLIVACVIWWILRAIKRRKATKRQGAAST